MSQSVRSAGMATMALIAYTFGAYLRGDVHLPAVSFSLVTLW